MIKNFFFLLVCTSLYASQLIPVHTQQLLLVEASDFNTSAGLLQAYERHGENWKKIFDPIPVNLGRSGLAWGKGLLPFSHGKHEPDKREGDGKSPAGLFLLEGFFGYDMQNFNFPYLRTDDTTLCIDDTGSDRYNQIIHDVNTQKYKSFEYMKRSDDVYKLGIIVAHNPKKERYKGSCIFIHIQSAAGAPTAGCTSMQESQLRLLMQWLNKAKEPLLLQLPEPYVTQIRQKLLD